MAIEFQKLHSGRVGEFQAQTFPDLAQGVIKVREVMDSHIADKLAPDFVVAGAAMQPAKKDEELHKRGDADNEPVRIHKSPMKPECCARLSVEAERQAAWTETKFEAAALRVARAGVEQL
jgi:hypothetical protein